MKKQYMFKTTTTKKTNQQNTKKINKKPNLLCQRFLLNILELNCVKARSQHNRNLSLNFPSPHAFLEVAEHVNSPSKHCRPQVALKYALVLEEKHCSRNSLPGVKEKFNFKGNRTLSTPEVTARPF